MVHKNRNTRSEITTRASREEGRWRLSAGRGRRRRREEAHGQHNELYRCVINLRGTKKVKSIMLNVKSELS